VPTRSSVLMRAALPKLPSTGRCDRQWVVSPGKRPNILSSLRSGTSLPPLATRLLLSTARKAPAFRREWLSMPPPTAMRTTVPIVTAAVTHNLPMDRTPKCTNRATKHGLAIGENATQSKPTLDEVYPKLFRPSLLLTREY
jgi:hypothetical protein